ncbi:MAG: HAD hydrolase-like protein, partial [Alphaproteobacteria bacterium]
SMGVPPSLFQYVLTAGEDLHTRIDRGNDPFYGRLGDAYYYVGPSQSALLDDLPLRKKSELNEADFILVMGPDDWHDDLSEFSELLEEAVQLKLPMVCANPNIGGFETGELHWEAGAIGKLYQQLGGQVHYHGKPEQSFFKAALNCFDDTPITKIIHIGDSIEADVRGAQQCGLDVAFTPYGIHSEDVTVFDEPGLSLAKLGEKWFAANSMQLPTFLIPGFKW